MVTVFTTDNKKSGDFELPVSWTTLEVSEGLIYEAVNAFRVNQRQGTVSTKTRGEVSGGGIKPFRQKGTGRARQGSIRSPLHCGGGTTFGPRPRPWNIDMPKAQRRQALLHALASVIKDDRLLVVDEWNLGDKPSTKALIKILNGFGLKSALLVIDGANETLWLSARNIPNVAVQQAAQLTSIDLLHYESIVCTKSALDHLKGRVGE